MNTGSDHLYTLPASAGIAEAKRLYAGMRKLIRGGGVEV